MKKRIMNLWGFFYGDIYLLYSHNNWALHSGWELVVCITARQIMHLGFIRET